MYLGSIPLMLLFYKGGRKGHKVEMQKCAVEFGFILTFFAVPTTRLLISIEETAGFVHRNVLAQILDIKFLLY